MLYEFGFVESSPKQDGRNMLMVLGPHKKKTEAKADVRAERDRRMAERQADAEAERAEQAARRAQHAAEPHGQAAPRTGGQPRSRRRPELTHDTARETEREHTDAEDEDPFGGQEAIPGDRYGQADAPQGGQDAPERAQGQHAHPPAGRRCRAAAGRRQEGLAACSASAPEPPNPPQI